jgi:hypothetical protein
MIEVDLNGIRHWRCAFCGMQYRSTAAARSCEDGHLDENRERRREPTARPKHR